MAKKQTTRASGSDAPAEGGDNTQKGFKADQLRALVERIERLDEEKQALHDDQKEVYAEAKGLGFDTATLRVVIRRRKRDANAQAEQDALLDLYLHALGMVAEPF
jgi:uncharacterized protein (UPF0335 family)